MTRGAALPGRRSSPKWRGPGRRRLVETRPVHCTRFYMPGIPAMFPAGVRRVPAKRQRCAEKATVKASTLAYSAAPQYMGRAALTSSLQK